jgi:transcriptional regulator with XRE-family HTH domain
MKDSNATGLDMRLQRHRYQLSQKEVADAMGVGQTRISDIERQDRVTIGLEYKFLDAIHKAAQDKAAKQR